MSATYLTNDWRGIALLTARVEPDTTYGYAGRRAAGVSTASVRLDILEEAALTALLIGTLLDAFAAPLPAHPQVRRRIKRERRYQFDRTGEVQRSIRGVVVMTADACDLTFGEPSSAEGAT
jgi:hypothetical protein